MSHKIFVLNGPNLNRLGLREPEVYGSETLADLERMCVDWGKALGMTVDFRQTNSEGTLVDWIHEAGDTGDGLVMNPGAYTHTSVALYDALRSVDVPAIEVHISNIFARESFRHHSYVSPVVRGTICGLGLPGYHHALKALSEILA